ncbi:DUF3857 domain-containing protein [Nitrospirillum pindoramense]|uniref:Tetratricopeptide repeat protein n=1 Tax=Nitrospirillum amazonense TaxID=28077 RepID=A0A560H8S5_9PROT|nr:DUF3857 domain-containing protein [Nitrospirillum amazonense]TWB42706.1 tetratricopeptide repeat protein [Nitrospirillum amazonense]
MRWWRVAAVSILWMGGAVSGVHAADKPVVAPAEPWVKTVTAPETLAGGSPSAATQTLLTDLQLHQAADGRSFYTHKVVRVQTPQGLGPLGSLLMSWNPDIDVLTLHQFQIRRGTQRIDLLPGAQPFTVLRRERNLEAAALDGTLTVTLQPPGLQVGDVLEYAYTLKQNDPVLQGNVSDVFGQDWSAPTARVFVRATWPQSRPLRWRLTEGWDKPKTGPGEFSIDMQNAPEIHGPKGAPSRFFDFRQLEISSYSSWADVAALMEPLYTRASVLAPDSPLNAEVAHIRAASSDPKLRAALALALVEDQVRYLFLGMNSGALVPAMADQTWTRRFGDCKAKTALLLALLHALDIQAEPALVSTDDGDGLDARLPMLDLFDHVMVRAHIEGHVYWLDGTREGDAGRDLDRLPVPYFHWALPLLPQGAALVPLVPPTPDEPTSWTTLRIDASDGAFLPARVHAERVMTGDDALKMKLDLDDLSAEARDRKLREYWTKRFSGLDAKTVSTHFDIPSGREVMVVDGEQILEWKPAGSGAQRVVLHQGELGWKPDVKRDPGLGQDAPYDSDFPYYGRTLTTLILPPEATGLKTEGREVDLTLMGTTLHRQIKLDRNVLTLDVVTRILAPEFSAPAETVIAEAAQIRALSQETVTLVLPADYRGTEKERAFILAKTPATAEEFVFRASLLTQKGDIAGALDAADKAIALKPDLATGYAIRGYLRLSQSKQKEALADFAKALTLDPASVPALNGTAMVALSQERYDDVVLLTTRILQLAPADSLALESRMGAYRNQGKETEAFADATELKRLDPQHLVALQTRAEVFRRRGQLDAALAEADEVVKLRPAVPEALIFKAYILGGMGKRADARALLDQAIALKPTSLAYARRAYTWDHTDYAHQIADLKAALAADKDSPDHQDILVALGESQGLSGDLPAAEKTLAQAINRDKDKSGMMALLARGKLYARLHRTQEAQADFAKARDIAGDDPSRLNEVCWARATANFELDAALADCDSALKVRPEAWHIKDSRAFVLLRLGRFDESIAEYDATLRARPTVGPSLYGRGLAKLAKGLTQEGQADLQAAQVVSPSVAEEFEDYGLKP